MSIKTTYDERRDELREMLEECLKHATEELLSKNTWGYEDMKEDYDLNIIKALRKLIRMV